MSKVRTEVKEKAKRLEKIVDRWIKRIYGREDINTKRQAFYAALATCACNLADVKNKVPTENVTRLNKKYHRVDTFTFGSKLELIRTNADEKRGIHKIEGSAIFIINGGKEIILQNQHFEDLIAKLIHEVKLMEEEGLIKITISSHRKDGVQDYDRFRVGIEPFAVEIYNRCCFEEYFSPKSTIMVNKNGEMKSIPVKNSQVSFHKSSTLPKPVLRILGNNYKSISLLYEDCTATGKNAKSFRKSALQKLYNRTGVNPETTSGELKPFNVFNDDCLIHWSKNPGYRDGKTNFTYYEDLVYEFDFLNPELAIMLRMVYATMMNGCLYDSETICDAITTKVIGKIVPKSSDIQLTDVGMTEFNGFVDLKYRYLPAKANTKPGAGRHMSDKSQWLTALLEGRSSNENRRKELTLVSSDGSVIEVIPNGICKFGGRSMRNEESYREEKKKTYSTYQYVDVAMDTDQPIQKKIRSA